jgi:ATP-dependent helicase/nuclease subunit A
MHDWFATRIRAAEQKLENVPINISFRSAPSILRAVDATFAHPDLQKGLGRTSQPHIAFRRGQPGLVELWPIMADSKAEEKNGDTSGDWTLPTSISDTQSGAAQLCSFIGDQIKGWLDSQETLPARGRPIEPGDIMILVRTRTAFVAQLVRALKTRGIPVSGVDRMVLKDQLAVQDIIAAARFALLPEDNLALAELLKSPFVGWDDDRLYQLAQPRADGQTLWAALRADTNHTALADWLGGLIRRAAQDHPFEFFSRLLQEACPADAISGLRAIRGRLGDDALDPLDEFLGRTLGFERANIPTLQGFVHWHGREAADVKRQMEEESGAVRIMTVHASKGLQAPIVILPDTLRGTSSRKTERILWPDRSDFPLPLFLPGKDALPQRVRGAYDRVEQKLEEEYNRLLYVAMTRAEDRLYVGGHHGKRAPLEESWYYAMQGGLQGLPETELIPVEGGAAPLLRLTNPATDTADRTHKNMAVTATVAAPPAWLREAAPAEPSPPRPLVPSRPSGPMPPAASPLASTDTYRFLRGTLTHTLLQFLPDLPAGQRAAAAREYLDRAGRDLPPPVRAQIAEETLGVLNQPDFAALFGPGSMAEVSVTGLVDDTTLIAGQIDRLLVTPDEILIIDYKTNRPPPQDAAGVPEAYLRQMCAYAAALRRIYPGRGVRGALLWTDGPTLMPLNLDKPHE